MLINSTNLHSRILMVSTEYPPMQGGVGRYTYNLTKELRKIGFDVHVACNHLGSGDFSGLSPANTENSDVLLKIVDKIKPDLVHIQYEHGLYGLKLDPINPTRTSTNIDSFYKFCKIPIVTTFHSAYTFKQWLNLIVATKDLPKRNIVSRYSNNFIRHWKRFINYYSFHNLNREKLARSEAGIVFSQYMSKMVGRRAQVIFHGSEPSLAYNKTQKKEARKLFSLPENGRIALALGFMTATKGWDILKKMNIPKGWTIVINSSKNHYSTEEDFSLDIIKKNNIVNLQTDFLNEEELSLLFSSADAVILPYKVSSGSGVMFDALAHGLPFVATDLEFFKEFSAQGLGITVRRNPNEFSKALAMLDRDYAVYVKEVDSFKKKISWLNVGKQHAQLYYRITEEKKLSIRVGLE